MMTSASMLPEVSMMNSTLAFTPEPAVKAALVNTSESSANVGCALNIASAPANVQRSLE